MFKKFLLTCLAFFGLVFAAPAQQATPLFQYSWAPVTTTGPVGTSGKDQYLDFGHLLVGLPVFHTVQVVVNGTAPSVCTFRVEGSLDYTNWFGLDVTAPATESCTASTLFHIPYKPVRALRVNVVSYTAGDQTTSVVFSYAGSK